MTPKRNFRLTPALFDLLSRCAGLAATAALHGGPSCVLPRGGLATLSARDGCEHICLGVAKIRHKETMSDRSLSSSTFRPNPRHSEHVR